MKKMDKYNIITNKIIDILLYNKLILTCERSVVFEEIKNFLDKTDGK